VTKSFEWIRVKNDQINAKTRTNNAPRVSYDRCHMPKENLQWKVSDAKRLLRAVEKAGFANRRMSLSKRPDGTLTIEVAPSEVLDLSRDLDDITNEWDKAND
jgi:hypothetical protein